MKITWTIVADCDPPPADDRLDDALELCDGHLDRAEDEIAGELLEAGAGFSIEITRSVEP